MPQIARRTQTEVDRCQADLSRWIDIKLAIQDDCVEALQTDMEFYGIDVHMTYVFHVPWYAGEACGNRSALSLAVLYGSVNCVAYLKEMGARSHEKLLASGYDLHLDSIGYNALYEELLELQKEEGKERWAEFASTRLGLDKWFAKDIFDECCHLVESDDGTYTCVCAIENAAIENATIWNGEDISDWGERLDAHDYCIATYDMYHEADFNALQLATFKYGRDSLITRLVRGETRKITKCYKLGFAALRYYADSQRASLLLAKNDRRLWVLLKGLTDVQMPVELREKIVDFAFFGKDAPEHKANS
jgi:hypothetical protein